MTDTNALQATVRNAQQGRGATVLVSGPAGIGKTHTLKQAATLAAGKLLPLLARGSELERDMPFGAALQLFEAQVRRSPDLLAGPAAMAARLFALDAGGAPGAFGEAEAQQLLIHSLYRLVAELAAQRPVALLVDDAHELDAPSLRLLVYLARRIRGLPALLVVTLRPSHPGAESHLLRELAQTPGVLRIEPRPLREEQVVSIVAGTLQTPLDPSFAGECVAVTGGNPLLVRELARGLAEHGATGSADDLKLLRGIGPAPVAWAVQTTLRKMSPAASAIARAASVFETHGTIELVAALAGVDQDTARQAVGELQVAELLEGDIELSFAHALVGQSVRASMPPAERALLHARAAELLDERGEQTAAAAHLLLSPGAARPWAVDALAGAAEQARRGASPERAVALLERALKEPPSAERRPGVLAELAHAQAAAGSEASTKTFAQAVEAAATNEERARLLLALARAHQHQARFADAAQVAAEGLRIDVRDERLRTELAAAHDTASIWISRRANSGAPEDPVAATRDLLAAARERLFQGRDHLIAVELARQAWAEDAARASAVGDDSTAIRLFAVLHNADAEREALELADGCLAAASRSGSRLDTATWRHMRGHALAYAGRLGEAEVELRAAFTASEDGWSVWLPVNAAALAYVLIERDELDEGDAVLAAAGAGTAHPRESPMWAIADAARGRLALVRGEPARALEILERAGERMRAELQIVNPACSPWRSDAVLALAALQRDDDALALAEEDLALAEAWGAPRALGGALRVRGLVGSADERLGWTARAVEALERSETLLDHAYALHSLGRAQREAGDDVSRQTLRVALDLAEQCGANLLARQVLAELHAAGSRPRRRRLQGPAALTAREADIAELARSGLSNREIAEHLVVTPRAVAFHLGNAYRKLGISSRRELGAALGPSAAP